MLKERVEVEEEDKNVKNEPYNLRTYAQILFLKAERFIIMHDSELAYRALYKA